MKLQLRKHRGAVLVIALVLLLIVTLLATTGMAMSIAEFVMAGNEQFHRKAIDAASAGVETAIARLSASSPDRRASVKASGVTAAGDFIASVKDVGVETNLGGFSAEKFIGRHFEISSDGAAARNASDAQIQGVLVIEAAAGTSTFTRIGEGLEAGGHGP
jgi:hypothetical protein